MVICTLQDSLSGLPSTSPAEKESGARGTSLAGTGTVLPFETEVVPLS